MTTQVITPEELTQVQSLQSRRDQLTIDFGYVEFQIQELELEKIAEFEAQSTANKEEANLARLALNQAYAVEVAKQATAMKNYEDKINKDRIAGYGTFFSGLASLSESSNKELAAIGKAAAISKATMDAYLAIQNALANVPFPANIAASVGIGVQAFANVD